MKRTLLLAGAAFAVLALAACNQAPQGAANLAAAASADQGAANVTSAASTDQGAPATVEGGPAQISTGATAGAQPPPPIPDYPQPPAPGPGYAWTPGYWGWNSSENNYYWAPGSWTQPPQSGLLWTPGYWAWRNGVYAFTGGHWGRQVGFYGGVNYGHGYGGAGYQGGEWRGDRFFNNRAVNNVGRAGDVYTRPVPPGPANRLSYNGGPGGSAAAPTPAERVEGQGPHVPPTVEQARREQQAAAEPRLRADQIAKGGGAAAVAEIQRRPSMAPVAAPARPMEERPMSQPARPEAQQRPEAHPVRSGEPARGPDERRPGPG